MFCNSVFIRLQKSSSSVTLSILSCVILGSISLPVHSPPVPGNGRKHDFPIIHIMILYILFLLHSSVQHNISLRAHRAISFLTSL